MDRPSKKILEEFEVYIKRDSVFRSNARLLESLWRMKKGLDSAIVEGRPLGSHLDLAVARRTGANFLTRDISNQVELALDSSKVTGALISEPRIWNNLLSSQPLAFNLFGELTTDLNLATGVFRSLEFGQGLIRLQWLNLSSLRGEETRNTHR